MKEICHPKAHFRFPPGKDIENEMRYAIEKKEFPRYLFKYMGVKGVLRFLDNAELLYSRPSDFNDPFDCKANIKVKGATRADWYNLLSDLQMLPGAMDYCIYKVMIDPDFAQSLVELSIEETKTKTGVLCLTAKNDNILMWSHYSDCHRGVCVKFDTLKDCPSFYRPIRVKYNDKYPSFNYIKERNALGESMFHKSKEWEYENEYRVLKTAGYGLNAISKESVVSIIFGCKIEESVEAEIRQKVINNNFSRVRFQRAVQDEESYKLNIVDVE